MLGETLKQVHDRTGEEVHGFVLMLTGALPADKATAKDLQARIVTAVDEAIRGFEAEGAVLTKMIVRMEPYQSYLEQRMPNGS